MRYALAFDAALAQRVCEEVAAHLDESAAAEDSNEIEAAEQRAIARFGDAAALASGFAAAALPRRLAATWRIMGLAALAVFVTMRLRAILAPVASSSLLDPVRVAAFIDRYAFIAALVIGVAGYGFLRMRSTAQRPRGVATPLLLAAGALAASTSAGLIALAGTLLRTGWSLPGAAPIVGAVGEITLLLCVFSQLHLLRRHASLADGQFPSAR